MEAIQALSHSTTNRKVFELVTGSDLPGRRVLDVGAGEGFFCQLLGEHLKRVHGLAPAMVLRACDLHPALFRYRDVPCDAIGPAGGLPYPDASFDVACSIEVVEHVEDQFGLARELYRVLRPGGRAILTTPNLLNVNSRLRYLRCGFWLLFDPLPLATRNAVHTAGHIHPVTFYYLAYLLRRAGFRDVRVYFDRHKTSALVLAFLLSPVLAAGALALRLRLRRKNPAVYRENAALLARQNSWGMLTSRSVIVEAIK